MTDDFLDLKGHMRWEIWGVHRGIGHPSEVINHHAPLTANAKEHATNRLIQKSFRQYGYVLYKGI